MKLNISAKELLALYDFFHDNCDFLHDANGSATEHQATLVNIYSRIRLCVLSALKNHSEDPIEEWFEREQSKINKLSLDTIQQKLEQHDTEPDALNKKILFSNDDLIAYPRKSHISRQRNKK